MRNIAAAQAPRRFPVLELFIALTVLIAVVGIAVVGLSSAVHGFGLPSSLFALAVLCGLGLVSHGLRESNVGQKVGLSFLSIVQLASIPIVGPFGAALVGGLAQALDPRRVAFTRRLFNTAMAVILGWSGGATYLLVGGTLDLQKVGIPGLLLHVAVPLLTADVVQMVVNAAFIAGVLRAERGLPVRVTFLGMVSTSGMSYLGYGAIGFLFAVLWVPAGVGPFSAVLILAPLSVARWVIVQYGDEVRSHESALSALVTAAETKDPHSVGHSARVAMLVEWLVEPMSLSVQEVSALRFAAMLHDVGKVGLPTRLVRRPGEMTREDLLVLAGHSSQGAELLRGVTFLEDSLQGIRHHHERWDGRGYPDGLVGEDIPVISRIIAVADAFDSLTMDRPSRGALDRDTALLQMRSRSSSHFDPAIVEALVRVLERHTWVPGVVEDAGLIGSGYFDHDDPRASDLYARLVADADADADAGANADADADAGAGAGESLRSGP